jgi:hypothetical protein
MDIITKVWMIWRRFPDDNFELNFGALYGQINDAGVCHQFASLERAEWTDQAEDLSVR